MAEHTVVSDADGGRTDPPALPRDLLPVLLLTAIYWMAGRELYIGWTMIDSYYTHGFLVPLVSAFFVWRDRKAIFAAPRRPSVWGYPWVAAASLMLLFGDFLGFAVIGQLSMIPMITGTLLLTQGVERTRRMWFPIAYLIFMIPIPASMTQSIALRLKLLATECAVLLARGFTLPMIREGSFVYFGNDHLLVGEVCGGLRSLISLLALGALVAYISKARAWAQWLLLFMSGPIAILSNVLRIFLLCVVGYFYGSKVAAGTVHDVSGIMIFVVAFVLFFSLEGLLRRVAPRAESPEEGS